MYNIDLATLKPVEKANTRAGVKKGQTFLFKVNTDTEVFTISNDLWKKMGLDTKGLKQFDGDTVVTLGVVSEDDATFLRGTKKGNKMKSFKSSVLYESLRAKGLIDVSKKINKLDLVHVGELDSVNHYTVVTL